MQQDKANDQEIELCCEFKLKDNEEDIITDYPRLFQVILGLQSNALKYTQKGHVKHIISTFEEFDSETESMQSVLHVQIEDTGLGIKVEDRHKLFKQFGYIENDQGMNTDGIGLGLVILDTIVKQFEGKIEFKSTHGGGSTFSFTFEL